MPGQELNLFQTTLKQKNLKFTSERRLIFESAIKIKHHFDADELVGRLKPHGVSRDTVYRAIPLLLESGVIQKSVGKGKGDYFEPTQQRGHHDHMVCVGCGKVIEFNSPRLEAEQEKVCKEHGFKLFFHDHRLFGHCDKCH